MSPAGPSLPIYSQAATWDPDGVERHASLLAEPGRGPDGRPGARLHHLEQHHQASDQIRGAAGDRSRSTPSARPSRSWSRALAPRSATAAGVTCVKWGDYSSMSLDHDGCTFWFTSQYYAADGLSYSTRIGSFSFPQCTRIGDGGTLSGLVTDSVTSDAIDGRHGGTGQQNDDHQRLWRLYLRAIYRRAPIRASAPAFRAMLQHGDEHRRGRRRHDDPGPFADHRRRQRLLRGHIAG